MEIMEYLCHAKQQGRTPAIPSYRNVKRNSMGTEKA